MSVYSSQELPVHSPDIKVEVGREVRRIIHFPEVLKVAEGASIVEEEGLAWWGGLAGSKVVFQGCFIVHGFGCCKVQHYRAELKNKNE